MPIQRFLRYVTYPTMSCEIAPQGHFLALRAQGATSACGLLAMTNLGAITVLAIARANRSCSAGSGMPLPNNGACGRRSATKPTSLQGGH